jgi:hypothetical protein
MERSNRIQQAYGYAVCLIAVITVLICTNGAVRNAIDMLDPVAAAGAYGEPSDSFDSWRASGREQSPRPDGASPDTASVESQRARYEAVRTSILARHRFQTRRDLATQVVLLVMAMVLFGTHWRWLQRNR